MPTQSPRKTEAPPRTHAAGTRIDFDRHRAIARRRVIAQAAGILVDDLQHPLAGMDCLDAIGIDVLGDEDIRLVQRHADMAKG